MKLATIRLDGRHAAARIEDDAAVEVGATDVGQLLADPGWRDRATAGGPRHPLSDVDYAPVVPAPSKIFCVGLNYRDHILEMGRELPTHPTLFAKFADALLGPADDLVLPAVSDQVDWEVELGVVIGAPLYRASAQQARDAIAGYTVVNDISMRDWQWRTTQWLAGKTFGTSTPAGPWLVTGDEVDHAADLAVRCEVDGALMQHDRTAELVHTPADIAAYISQLVTLRPGDLIATGTPGGVGAGRDPKVFLEPGQIVRTSVEGLGECVNRCVKDAA
jgi:acylpyruvate hydrolase